MRTEDGMYGQPGPSYTETVEDLAQFGWTTTPVRLGRRLYIQNDRSIAFHHPTVVNHEGEDLPVGDGRLRAPWWDAGDRRWIAQKNGTAALLLHSLTARVRHDGLGNAFLEFCGHPPHALTPREVANLLGPQV